MPTSPTWIAVLGRAYWLPPGGGDHSADGKARLGASPCCCAASVLSCLLDFNFCAGFRELLLQAFCILFGYTFLHRFWSAVNEVLGLFQA